ncbi:MAG: hypothetical protein FJ137_20325 [Deltaproteobacteria bacterium]|nr:hypothetical protein [Deltaproteobacteria bacterium]
MKLTPATLHARARALVEGGASVQRATDALLLEIGPRADLPRAAVESAVLEAFAAFAQTQRVTTPVQRAAVGTSAFDVLLRSKGNGTAALRLDPWKHMSESERGKLSPADRASIDTALRELERKVAAQGLSYVPVFGYLSLRNRNADVFGKPQEQVVPGKDVVDATLPGWDVGVVLSTLYRGSPTHPGAVAGLSAQEDASTPGAVLKLPLADAGRMLARLIVREMIGESDLEDRDARTSNGMYIPRVLDVTLADGASVPALVFVTNPEGAKDPTGPTGEPLSVGQLAYFMLGKGGFVGEDGTQYGGSALDYWEKSYLALKVSLDEPVNPSLQTAIEVAKLVEQQKTSDATLRLLLEGSFVPLDTVRFHKGAPHEAPKDA